MFRLQYNTGVLNFFQSFEIATLAKYISCITEGS